MNVAAIVDMNLPINPQPVPLRVSEDGVVLIGKTRVPLDTVVVEYKQGANAEEIAEQFSALDLADIYAVISYYLHHQDDVEQYLQQRQQQSEAIHAENEKRFPSQGLRDRLLARRNLTGNNLLQS